MNAVIRQLLAKSGRLSVDVSTLEDDHDLYEAGLSSFATVQLMLLIEERFKMQFPEHMLNRRTFASIGALVEAVSSVVGVRAAA